MASTHRNRIYEILKAVNTPAEVFAGEDEPDIDEYAIQNDFYNIFYGRAVREILDLVNEQVKEYGEEKSFSRKGAEVQREHEIKELEELFYDKKQAERCIDILRKHEYPLIGDQYNYIGKLKGGPVSGLLS